MSNKLDDKFFLDADAFFTSNAGYALTYDDVSLATQYSDILPRETKLDTTLSDSIHLSLPIISSDMDTVTESQMAIGMARNGGMGLIHCNMSQKEQLVEVARVKNYIHGLIQEPIKVSPDMLIGDVLKIVSDKNFRFRTFPVVDSSNRLVGLLPGSIVKERYAALSVAKAMTPRAEVFTVSQKDLGSDPIAVADAFFDEHFGVHKLLVVDDDDKLRGLFTLSDIERISAERDGQKKNARDSKFRLLCGASIAMIRKPDGSLDFENMISHVGALVDEGLDVAAVSTAHGFTEGVGSTVKALRQAFPNLTLIGGNVTNGAGVEFLAKCGADKNRPGAGINMHYAHSRGRWNSAIDGSLCMFQNRAGIGGPNDSRWRNNQKRRHGKGADSGRRNDLRRPFGRLPGSSRTGYGNQWKDVQTVPRYGKLVRNEGRQRGKVRARYKK